MLYNICLFKKNDDTFTLCICSTIVEHHIPRAFQSTLVENNAYSLQTKGKEPYMHSSVKGAKVESYAF